MSDESYCIPTSIKYWGTLGAWSFSGAFLSRIFSPDQFFKFSPYNPLWNRYQVWLWPTWVMCKVLKFSGSSLHYDSNILLTLTCVHFVVLMILCNGNPGLIINGECRT